MSTNTADSVLGADSTPSRIIHISNLPLETSATEVIQLGVPFGRVIRGRFLEPTKQAILEMADDASAAHFVAHCHSNPLQVRGQPVFVQLYQHHPWNTNMTHLVAHPNYNSRSPFGSPLPISDIDNSQNYNSRSPFGSPQPISDAVPVGVSMTNPIQDGSDVSHLNQAMKTINITHQSPTFNIRSPFGSPLPISGIDNSQNYNSRSPFGSPQPISDAVPVGVSMTNPIQDGSDVSHLNQAMKTINITHQSPTYNIRSPFGSPLPISGIDNSQNYNSRSPFGSPQPISDAVPVGVSMTNPIQDGSDVSHLNQAMKTINITHQSPTYNIRSPFGSPLPISGIDNSQNNNNRTPFGSPQPISDADPVGVPITSPIHGGQYRVLFVIVESLLLPVSLEILHQIFQRFGMVLKMLTITLHNSFYAFIQFFNAHEAKRAKVVLDGQNVYNGCCRMRIKTTKMPMLNIEYNNANSRDFTNPYLPPGAPGFDLIAGAGGLVNAAFQYPPPPIITENILTGSPNVRPTFSQGMGSPRSQADAYAAALASVGVPIDENVRTGLASVTSTFGHGIGWPRFQALTYVATFAGAYAKALATANAAYQHSNLTVDGQSGTPDDMPTFGQGIGSPSTQAAAYAAAVASVGVPNDGTFSLGYGYTNILRVSNLDKEMVTPDALFTLFGVYGDVISVKILYTDVGTALVQMTDPHQACLEFSTLIRVQDLIGFSTTAIPMNARIYLDTIRLWSKNICVMTTNITKLHSLNETMTDGEEWMRDYHNSPLHRFKNPRNNNYRNIYPPAATLHVSNIPADVAEKDICAVFIAFDFEVKAFRFFPLGTDRNMAFVQLSSIEDGVLALIKTDNYPLRTPNSGTNHIRVGFSRSDILEEDELNEFETDSETDSETDIDAEMVVVL